MQRQMEESQARMDEMRRSFEEQLRQAGESSTRAIEQVWVGEGVGCGWVDGWWLWRECVGWLRLQKGCGSGSDIRERWIYVF